MNEIVQNAIEKVKTVFSSVKNKIIELYFDNKKVFTHFHTKRKKRITK